MSLRDYGWTDFFEQSLKQLGDPALEPARVLHAAAGSLRLVGERGETRAALAGRLRHDAEASSELPAVGDWVAVRALGTDEARVERVLDRRSRLSRKVAGKRAAEQVVAANIDVAVVVMGLDGDFSERRVERYLTTIWQSGARPVVLLNKLDVCPVADERQTSVERIAVGVPVLLASCLDGTGVDAVREQIKPGETTVLLGSSGAGKSTLINRLFGRAIQTTAAVRESDDTGRHTTTHRELFRSPDGRLLIDSPGIRELQLWVEQESLTRAFDDIGTLTAGCRFRDCRHESEAGCEVLAAVESGSLSASRLESYRQLRGELRYLELRQSASAQQVQKKKWRAIHRELRRSGKNRRK